MKRTIIFLLCLTLITACGAPPQPATPAPDYSTLVVTMERTPCFGTCPVYKLMIFGNGQVEYEGLNFVNVQGQQTATLTADQVKELIAELEKADFFELEGSYTVNATDLPSTIVTVTLDSRSKKIEHYGICGSQDINSAPQVLCDLEQKIDSITNSTQWTGK
jgi:hypothetical protein